ncbi:DUF120 domain-containing protein [Candidatus Woesearchaeota archaeon]|jgi:riboflavin kinase, archaea type|nr:DUF120 domain-containing protein [Candidatus Woesearchaeota archaeon]
METKRKNSNSINQELDGNIQHLPLLLYLSQKLGLNKTNILSTVEIANDMKFSQQTASRKMLDLEELGFIKRKYSPNGLMIGLTEKAVDLLKANYNHLKNMFDNSKSSKQDRKINGLVTSGIGEGKFYVQLQRYNEEFTKLLGKKPFPGTLNLIVDRDEYKELLLKKELVKVEGFKTKERSFGCINCYKINVQNVKNNKRTVEAFIIIPERTSHPENVAEIIATDYLREKLKINDNDKVEIL